MKLSRTASYALQAALRLAEARSGKPVPCSRLAEEGRLPARFLLQILRNLVHHGILESTRGVEGGYSLQRSPDDVSLLEVIEAVDGPLTASVPQDERLPAKSRAKLEQALANATARMRRELSAVTLAQLLPRGRPRAARRRAGSSPARATRGRKGSRGTRG